jgi:hypothetical protein
MKFLTVLSAAIPLALLNLVQVDSWALTACKQADECHTDGCHFYYTFEIDSYHGVANDDSSNEGTNTVCSGDGIFCVKHDNDDASLSLEYGNVWTDLSATKAPTYRNGLYLCQDYNNSNA